MKPCSVNIDFDTKEMSDIQYTHLLEAEKELAAAGVTFDTGTAMKDGKRAHRSWEFDWTLQGATVWLKNEDEIADDKEYAEMNKLEKEASTRRTYRAK